MEGFWHTEKPVFGNPFWIQYEHDKKAGYIHEESLWNRLPIKWESLPPSPLYELLYHSDCEGEIEWEKCGPIADALEALIPKMKNDDAGGHIGLWKAKTQQFVDGLRLAHSRKENVDFH
jgi:hypothetical protein